MTEIQITKMREPLRKIAYPRRGTDEQQLDIFQAAEVIQAEFTLEDLEA